jgi:hypothetical protein
MRSATTAWGRHVRRKRDAPSRLWGRRRDKLNHERSAGVSGGHSNHPMNSTTQRQRAICRFIHRYTQEHGWPPSRREIGQALRIESLGHVEYWLRVLAQHGYLHITPHISRGLTLTAAGLELAESKITAPLESERGHG